MTAKIWLWSNIAVWLVLSCAGFAQKAPADTILLHGRIYTVNARLPWAQALAVRDGKLIAVGSDRDMGRFRGKSTTIIDAKHHLVFPGFTDCHAHFLDGSFTLQELNLDDAKTVAEVQQRLRAYAAVHKNEPWLLGRGWMYPLFLPSGLPDKKYLDEIVSDRPVYLESYDGHTWWANSKALESASVSKETRDPPGGKIVRDQATGEPTGAIQEDAADELIRRAIPEPSTPEKLAALRAGMRHANALGVVRVHVPGSVYAHKDDLQSVGLIEELRKKGDLTVRFSLAYRLDPPEVTDRQVQEILNARERYHDDWISAGSVKFFIDGVIETHTAVMMAPYSNEPVESGRPLWDVDKYRSFVARLDALDIQIFTHATGDGGVRLALDAYENAAKANHTSDRRHRVEHVEEVSVPDIPRFGKLGVVASMQPLHAYPDEDLFKSWIPSVGPDRSQRGWPWHSIQASGGVLAFGSDWPIVTLNPWEGLQNALTRQTTEGEPPGGWLPSERISLADAIKGYTLNAAFAGHREKDEGSLEVGKLADFIVISQDIFKVAPSKISDTQVLLTIVGGRIAYKSDRF